MTCDFIPDLDTSLGMEQCMSVVEEYLSVNRISLFNWLMFLSFQFCIQSLYGLVLGKDSFGKSVCSFTSDCTPKQQCFLLQPTALWLNFGPKAHFYIIYYNGSLIFGPQK